VQLWILISKGKDIGFQGHTQAHFFIMIMLWMISSLGTPLLVSLLLVLSQLQQCLLAASPLGLTKNLLMTAPVFVIEATSPFVYQVHKDPL
jgi:hypothetical protein